MDYTSEQIANGDVGVNDLGEVYGYCYRPVRFTNPSDGVTGTSTYHPHTVMGRHFACRFPLFDILEEAIGFLRHHGYYGHVQRYARNNRCLSKSHPDYKEHIEEVTVLAGMVTLRKVEPWLTAGIVAIVNATVGDGVHVQLLAAANNPLVVFTDGKRKRLFDLGGHSETH